MKIGTEPPIEKNNPKLSDLNLEVPKIPIIDGPKNEYTESFKATFNNIPLTVQIESEVVPNGITDNLGVIILRIVILTENKEYIASSEVSFTKYSENGVYEAVADVTSNKNKDIKLKGIGRAVWEMSLNLIQKFADKFNTTVIDKLHRLPREKLPVEKWDELFSKLLDKHGYLHEGGNEWTKIYKPNKK